MNKWIGVISIILISLIVYSNTFTNEFVYDDVEVIEENTLIKDWRNLPFLFTNKYFILSHERTYRPICTLSFFIDYSLWKLNVFGWHLSNFLFHIFNAILIYFVCFYLARDSRIALLTSLLFVAHPVQTETVCGISFREDLITFSFFLLSYFLYIKMKTNKSTIHLILYISSLVCYLFGLFTKEMGITLPFVLLLHNYCFSYQKAGRTGQELKQSRVVLPYLVIGVSYIAGKYLLFRPSATLMKTDAPVQAGYLGGSLYITLLTMSKVFFYYVKLLLFPIKLSADYVIPLSFSFFEPEVLFSILFLTLILIIGIKTYKKSKLISFSIFYFFITLLPVSNIIPFGATMAERYLYFSSFGFCILLAVLIMKIYDLSSKSTKRFVILFCCVLIASYSIRSRKRNADWKDHLSLWSKTVETSPQSSKAHYNLGLAYHKRGRDDEAILEYKETIRLDPDYKKAHNNLGLVYERKGWYEQAISQYKELIKLDPDYKEVHYNLGLAYSKKGQYDQAVSAYKEAIRFDPDYKEAHYNLGLVYEKKKLNDLAILEYKEAIRLDPDYKKAHNNLGAVYRKKGWDDQAILEFKKAIELDPTYKITYINLGSIYMDRGMYRQAADKFQKVLEIEPDNTLAKRKYKQAVKFLGKEKF